MIPQHATHIAIDRADGDRKSYYQITKRPFSQISIQVWDDYNQKWAESAYESESEMMGDDLELVEL